MKRFTMVTMVGAVAIVVVPVILSKAGVDGNEDGCVDLRDYAIMQSQLTGPGCTPKEIASFYAEGEGELILVPEVPGVNGFILTDVITQRSAPITQITFIEESGAEETTKLSVTVGASGDPSDRGDDRSYHFRSGIPFKRGARIKIEVSNSNLVQITLSGYTY